MKRGFCEDLTDSYQLIMQYDTSAVKERLWSAGQFIGFALAAIAPTI